MQPHIEQAVLRTKYDKTGFQMPHILNHPSVDVHVVLKEKKGDGMHDKHIWIIERFPLR